MTVIRTALVLGLVVVAEASASAQETTRASMDSAGVEGNGDSINTSISADGRVVAFQSNASNLVIGDTNGFPDIFVFSRLDGTTECVSLGSAGSQGNGSSYYPSISADGEFVVFTSSASNLVANDTNACADVFVHNRVTGATDRISVDSAGAQGNAGSYPSASISTDGQFVAFYSDASNLVVGDTNGHADVFVKNRVTGATERVSVDSTGAEGDGDSMLPSVSADGRFVGFMSLASNLSSGDTNGSWDVFVHDRVTGVTECVSVDSTGALANDGSYYPSISPDGSFVAFESSASNLIANDTNGYPDVFVHDRGTGTTERVSIDSSGAQGDSNSYSPSISADGKLIAFYSDATNLVPGDTNGVADIFLRDRAIDFTECVSVNSSGAVGNGSSSYPAMTPDGQFIAFHSSSSDLVSGDTNGVFDAFVRERCGTPATWSNFGSGFPGTNGVPSFTAESDPVLGSTLTLDLANSYGRFGAGLLFVGFQRTQIHSGWGGDLLVLPVLTIAIGLPASGTSFTGSIPSDASLCGFVIDLQAIESDPGAAKGVSFTEGLEVVLGR